MRKEILLNDKKCFFEYRLPNIIEGPRFMQSCGFSLKKMQDADWVENHELGMLADAIEQSGKFVTKIDVEINGKKVKKYEELFEIKEMQAPLYELAGEILKSLQPDEKKKALSK